MDDNNNVGDGDHIYSVHHYHVQWWYFGNDQRPVCVYFSIYFWIRRFSFLVIFSNFFFYLNT